MRVFVTGGTGAVGPYAVRALVGAGHDVRALARSDTAADSLRECGATPVRVSLFDRDELTEALAGCDAVANLASALPSTAAFVRESAWAECHRVRREGSAAVVDAAVAANVPRVLQESVAMLYEDAGDRWIDETCSVEEYPIATGNHAAEASARRFAGSGGVGVVLRFGIFYGRGAAHSEQIMALARRRIAVLFGRAEAYTSSIHVADAGDAVVAALGAQAGIYNIVDDQPVTKKANTAAMAVAVRKSPLISVPGRAALVLGERTTSLTRSLRVSNELFRTTTGWAPRYPSVWEGYAHMAGQPGHGDARHT